MKIRFENTIDDFVAFALFHNDFSPAARRIRLRATWLFGLSTLLIVVGLAMKMSAATERGDEGQLLNVGVVSLILIVFVIALIRMPGGFRRRAERQTRQMYAEGANKSVLGTRELELVGNELISRSAYSESRLRLEAVERVVSCEGYTFIFINALTAYVIPHGAVLEGDHEKFTEAISNRISPVSSH